MKNSQEQSNMTTKYPTFHASYALYLHPEFEFYANCEYQMQSAKN